MVLEASIPSPKALFLLCHRFVDEICRHVPCIRSEDKINCGDFDWPGLTQTPKGVRIRMEGCARKKLRIVSDITLKSRGCGCE